MRGYSAKHVLPHEAFTILLRVIHQCVVEDDGNTTVHVVPRCSRNSEAFLRYFQYGS